MINEQRTSNSSNLQENLDHHQNLEDNELPIIRDIHPLTPPRPQRVPRGEAWETNSHRSSALSMASTENGENFTTMSREFSALVLAGSTINPDNQSNNLERIGEEDNFHEETNPLAIVPDNSPLDPVQSPRGGLLLNNVINGREQSISVQRVKKEEVESKINAWQNAKIAKINNRFKRDDAIINGWEDEQVQKSTSKMKKVERKLEAKRAKAMEKMQNTIAKAHRKAEEKRASAEAKRGTKVARILEVANLMKAVGRAPVKRSFF